MQTLARSNVSRSLSSVFRYQRCCLPFALAVALAGCSVPFQWVKDGYDTQQGDAKFAACQLEAERLLYSSEESDTDRAARVQHESRLCMKAAGWHWVPRDGSPVSDEPGERPVIRTSAGLAESASAEPAPKQTRGGASGSTDKDSGQKRPDGGKDEGKDDDDSDE